MEQFARVHGLECKHVRTRIVNVRKTRKDRVKNVRKLMEIED